MIDNPESRGYPLTRLARVLLGVWGLLLVGGFAVAVMLEPDPRGYGTHQRFGLPPCTFRTVLGLPCPSCGMTTSFSHFVRGRMIEAAQANAAGLLLAVVCAVQIPWTWASAYQGRLLGVARPDVGLMWLLVAICGGCLLQWAARLWLL